MALSATAIHAFARSKNVDARHKAGHDDRDLRSEKPYAALAFGCTSAR
jgi:hypothetical protein